MANPSAFYLQVLLFKNYDNTTDANVKARTCVHTAFGMPREEIPADATTRESIEVRALIFTYPKTGTRPPNVRTLPLAHADSSLEAAVKRVGVDSIMHRLRTDIGERQEIIDAVLILRKQEIQRQEGQKDILKHEYERLATEIELARTKIKVHAECIQELLAKFQEWKYQMELSKGRVVQWPVKLMYRILLQ